MDLECSGASVFRVCLANASARFSLLTPNHSWANRRSSGHSAARFFGLIALLTRLLLATLPASAQEAGTLTGFVLDARSEPIAGALIRAADQRALVTRETLTDKTGFYRLANLPLGEYDVSASAPGFLPAQVRALHLGVDARPRVDFALPPATLPESVQVHARIERIQMESSEQGATLDEQLLQSLPLNRRDFLQLALLVPGVLPPVQDSALSSRGSFAMHANGGREEFNNFLLDGVSNNDPYTGRYVLQPPVDAISEFKISTSTYSAGYGRSSAGQVSVATRGGGDEFHGSIYEYFRNRTLNARNFFDGPDKPPFLRNQFGVTAGGPVVKNRAFFFVNFDRLREQLGLSRLATVPTPAERAGDFSASGQTILDPLTRQRFPGNQIPANRISPVALEILKLFPPPTLPGRSGNYRAQPAQTETQSRFLGRLDARLSNSDELTLRYAFTRQAVFEPFAQGLTNVPGFGDFVVNTGHNALVHHQHVFSSRTILSSRFAINRSPRQVLPQNRNTDVGKLWGVNWLQVSPRDFGFPAINISGLSALGDVSQLPIVRETNVYQFTEDVSLSRSNHGLQFGGELTHSQFDGFLDLLERGSLSFSGVFTGSGLADFLLGFPSFGIQSQFDNPQKLGTTTHGLYLQDDWKAGRSLTLNLGLRYEHNTPATDPADRMTILQLTTGRLVQVGTNGVPRAGIRTDRNNFAPRIGLAWRLAPNLALRAGYGIYYDAGILVVNSTLYFNPPYFNIRAFFPTATSLLTLDNPFPASAGVVPPPALNTLSPDLTTAYLQNWSLNLQRQLGASILLSVAYAGSKGTHLIHSRDLNQPPPGPGSVALRRPNPNFGGIFFVESGGNSNFHSLQVSVRRQLAAKLSFLVAYTLSKSIDDTSAFLGTTADKNFPQNSRDYGAERALSSFDLRHRLSVAYVYAVPGHGWWNRNLEIQGILTAQTGQPFTPMLRFDNSNTGNTGGIFGNDRPNVLRDPALSHRTPEQWFDTSAFAIPRRYTFGDARRNILRGPGLVNFDFGMGRRFQLRESRQISLAAQAFNLFNHARLDLPEHFADESPTFGKIFSAKAPRQIQLAVRFSF